MSAAPVVATPWPLPAGTRAIDLVSDLHLCAALPRTAQALLAHIAQSPAEVFVLLGDVFEAWVGDDMALGDEASAAAAGTDPATASDAATSAAPGAQGSAPRAAPLSADDAAECAFAAAFGARLKAALRGRTAGFMAGNRDFLVGPRWLAACGLQHLPDPTVIEAFGQRWLLSHGDALCLADTDYQRFRAQVQSPAWQAAVLARPLAERLALARQMRAASMARQAEQARATGHTSRTAAAASAAAPAVVAEGQGDLDGPACVRWLQAAEARILIHGHTHRPAEHRLPDDGEPGTGDAPPLRRIVLSDWDCDHATPPRAEVLRLQAGGTRRIAPLRPAGTAA